MIGQERPGIHGEAGRLDKGCKTREKFLPVSVVPEDRAPLYSSHHHVVKDTWGIKTRATRHDGMKYSRKEAKEATSPRPPTVSPQGGQEGCDSSKKSAC